jgi:hypothetical protein
VPPLSVAVRGENRIVINAAYQDIPERQPFLVNVAALFQRWYRRIDAAQFPFCGISVTIRDR